ncbi:MAG: hypothetical protein HYS12_28795 [Planctomycetes bacterium]|nr:hypothetical protein [Planctomycetota bacterium]
MMRAGSEPVARIRHGFRRVTGRLPQEDEIEMLEKHYRRWRDEYRDNPAVALQLLAVGEAPRDPTLDAAELAAWTSVASVLLNLDETISKE